MVNFVGLLSTVNIAWSKGIMKLIVSCNSKVFFFFFFFSRNTILKLLCILVLNAIARVLWVLLYTVQSLKDLVSQSWPVHAHHIDIEADYVEGFTFVTLLSSHVPYNLYYFEI